jgi:hypothetical protein
MNFKIGDKIQCRDDGSWWGYFGTVLGVELIIGHPATLTVRLDGMIMADGDRVRGSDDPDNPFPIVTISEAYADYLRPQEEFLHG